MLTIACTRGSDELAAGVPVSAAAPVVPAAPPAALFCAYARASLNDVPVLPVADVAPVVSVAVEAPTGDARAAAALGLDSCCSIAMICWTREVTASMLIN
jgi:hypothetical protein